MQERAARADARSRRRRAHGRGASTLYHEGRYVTVIALGGERCLWSLAHLCAFSLRTRCVSCRVTRRVVVFAITSLFHQNDRSMPVMPSTRVPRTMTTPTASRHGRPTSRSADRRRTAELTRQVALGCGIPDLSLSTLTQTDRRQSKWQTSRQKPLSLTKESRLFFSSLKHKNTPGH